MLEGVEKDVVAVMKKLSINRTLKQILKVSFWLMLSGMIEIICCEFNGIAWLQFVGVKLLVK